MPNKARPYHLGIPCHLIARGVAKQPIFLDDQDYRAFLRRLRRAALSTRTSVLGFCPIWNHLHILAERFVGQLGGFMSSLLTSYAQYFNKKYARVGHVFQNRFRLKRCLDDSYLKTVLAYIHLNPVKAGLVPSVEDWRWSSHRYYTRDEPPSWVRTSTLLGLYGGKGEYLKAVGTARIEELPDEAGFLPSEQDFEEIDVDDRLPLSAIAAGVSAEASLRPTELFQSRRFAAVRARAAFILRALDAGYSAAEVSRTIGCTQQAISMMLARLQVVKL